MKLSKYNVIVNNESTLLFNTKSQALVELDENGINELNSLNSESNLCEAFLDMGYWVYDHVDEISELIFANKLAVYDNAKARIVLKTTDDCNFRCSYCYQDHQKNKLCEDKLNILLLFVQDLFHNTISNTKREISIEYFGGEPLMELPLILQFEAMMNANGIPHKSSMTTNGFLLNEETISKLLKVNINRFQITLDGPSETHDNTRFHKDGIGTFDIIFRNVKHLMTHDDVHVTLRTNLSPIIEPHLNAFIDFINKNELFNERLYMIITEAMNYTNDSLSGYYGSRRLFAKAYLAAQKKLIESGQRLYRYGRRSVYCSMANANALIINPKLEIESCTACNAVLGYIDQDSKLNRNSLFYQQTFKSLYEQKKCYDCVALPMCMGGCPLLDSLGQDRCIPEKYVLSDLIPLYKRSAELHGEDGL